MKKEHKILINRAAWILFILYLIVLVYFLFFSERYGRTSNDGYRSNLMLFKEIRRFIRYRDKLGWESFVVNIFGNIFAFSPFGFVLPIISPLNRKFLNVALLSLELTLTIEVMQLLLKVGIFDVDDIFLNTLGGMIGYFAFWLAGRFLKREKRS